MEWGGGGVGWGDEGGVMGYGRVGVGCGWMGWESSGGLRCAGWG